MCILTINHSIYTGLTTCIMQVIVVDGVMPNLQFWFYNLTHQGQIVSTQPDKLSKYAANLIARYVQTVLYKRSNFISVVFSVTTYILYNIIYYFEYSYRCIFNTVLYNIPRLFNLNNSGNYTEKGPCKYSQFRNVNSAENYFPSNFKYA